MADQAHAEDDAWEEDAEDDSTNWWQDCQPTASSSSRGTSLKRALDFHGSPSDGDPEPSKRQVIAPTTPPELTRWTSNSSWSDDGNGSSWKSSSWWNSRSWWSQGAIQPGDRDDIKQWLECTRVGRNVPGTPIVPCKTPFEGRLADRAHECGMLQDEDWFGKEDLLRICRDQGTPVGLVIDLVNTYKYYNGFVESDNVEYRKVKIAGRTVPSRDIIEEVFDIIDDFVSRRPDKFVALHCTHGVNRTGFLVAAYLMTRAHLPLCKQAVAAFEKARGFKIDKTYLLEALMHLQEGKY